MSIVRMKSSPVAQTRLRLSGQRMMGKLYLWMRRLTTKANRSRVVILKYHEVGSSPLALSPEQFAAQMQYLADRASVVSLRQLLARKSSEPRPPLECAITFDDGYVGVYDHALPILERHGFPATVFLTTEAIQQVHNAPSDLCRGLDPGQRMLSWWQVHLLVEGGFTLGSHLCQHFDLSHLSPEEAWLQLTFSKATIEMYAGSPCIYLAYPRGRFSRRSVNWVHAAGYEGAMTALHSGVPSKFDPYRVPRLSIERDHTLDDFQAVVRGDWDYLAFPQMLRRPILWYPALQYSDVRGTAI
jgi:peptidoglycan/xylan/chitin deacetylase (PgdA/CDA1 family)